jgi:hypothetical protein
MKKGKRLIERQIHFVFGAVGPGDVLVLPGVIETNHRQHQPAFYPTCPAFGSAKYSF